MGIHPAYCFVRVLHENEFIERPQQAEGNLLKSSNNRFQLNLNDNKKKHTQQKEKQK